MFKAVHHFNLIVSNIAETKRFFVDVLGLTVALETVIEDPEFSRGVGLEQTKVQAVFFQLPGTSTLIETFQYLNPADGKPIPPVQKANDHGWTHMCFQVEDIQQAYRHLQENGATFLTTPVTLSADHPDFAGVRFCYFRGPDGEIYEILQG
jgi:glyoxylase I family protein